MSGDRGEVGMKWRKRLSWVSFAVALAMIGLFIGTREFIYMAGAIGFIGWTQVLSSRRGVSKPSAE